MFEDKKRLSGCAINFTSAGSACSCLRDELEIGRDLFDKRLSHNLRLHFDELEDLSDSLTWRKIQVGDGSQLPRRTHRRTVARTRMPILEHFLGRVTEGWSMT